MECPICRTGITPEGANFCPQCGKPLGDALPGDDFVTYIYVALSSGKRSAVRIDPEKLERELNDIEKICRRYRATTERIGKNSLVAKFVGAQAGQQSPVTAVLTALEIKDSYIKKTSLDTAEPSLPAFIGIDGGIPEKTVSVFGLSANDEVIERAQRLAAKAAANSILAGSSIAKNTESQFAFKTLGFYRLKMDKTPRRLYEVSGVKTSGTAALKSDSPRYVIGRKDQLTCVRRTLEETNRGKRPSAVIIFGGPGMGKTELLCQLTDDALNDGWSVIFIACDELNRYTPYKIWKDVYLKLSGSTAGTDDDGYIAGMPARGVRAAEVDEDPAETGERINDAFRETIESAASGGPVLVAIEDLHLVDYASLETLNYIFDRLENVPLAVVATSRVFRSSVHCPHLSVELSGFDGENQDELIDFFSDASGADINAVRNIYERCLGNPLLIDRLIKTPVRRSRYTVNSSTNVEAFNISEITINLVESLDTGTLALLESLYFNGGFIRYENLERSLAEKIGIDTAWLIHRIKWLADNNLVAIYKDSFGNYVGLRGYCRDALGKLKSTRTTLASAGALRKAESFEKPDPGLDAQRLLRIEEYGLAYESFIECGKTAAALGAPLDAICALSAAIEIAESGNLDERPGDAGLPYYLRSRLLKGIGVKKTAAGDLETALSLYDKETTPVEYVMEYAALKAETQVSKTDVADIIKRLRNALVDAKGAQIPFGLTLIGNFYLYSGGLKDAIKAYGEALSSGPEPKVKAELLWRSGLAKTMANEIDGAIKDYESALEIDTGPPAEAIAAVLLAAVLSDRGQYPRAVVLAHKGLDSLAGFDRLTARKENDILMALAFLSVSPLGFNSDLMDSVPASVNGLNEISYIAFNNYSVAVKGYLTGDADRVAEAAAAGYPNEHHLWNKIIYGAVSILNADFNIRYFGDFAVADVFVKSAAKTFEETGFPFFIAECNLMAAELATAIGNLSGAEELLTRPEVVKKTEASYLFLASYNRVLGELTARKGDRARGAELVSSAAGIYKDNNLHTFEAFCYNALADILGPADGAEYRSKARWLLQNTGAFRWAEYLNDGTLKPVP